MVGISDGVKAENLCTICRLLVDHIGRMTMQADRPALYHGILSN